MIVRPIILYPNKILRQKAPVITKVDSQLEREIDDLREVLKSETAHAAGLAATQIGLNSRFFGLVLGEKREMKVFVNPKIELCFGDKVRPMMVFENGEKEEFLEGCLSFPNLFGVVKRFLKIRASWQEIEEGKLVGKGGDFEGIEAIAFQHELEHLDGILFIDHILEEKGKLYEYGKDGKRTGVEVEKIVDLENGK